ncbi:MAG: STAS domain-containing protein [Saprospiraceae bacterium]|jgi:anti-anti-sigma factor|nr:STAS domain-containing protein [Saprospiraceae bacterium]
MNNIYHFAQRGNAKVLFVDSLFNELENKQIISSVSNLIENGQINFVIDLSKVPFINSAGLNCLLSIQHKTQKAGGQFALSGVSSQVVKLLEITKLKPFFRLTSDINADHLAVIA